MNFLVLGLPRSRTAWLANFLTFDGQFCYHEGMNGCKSINEYKVKMKGKGDSNTGIMFFDYESHFPSVKTIIIDSDVNKSIEFGINVFNADNNSIDLLKKIKLRLDNIDGLHINLEDINDRLNDIWDFVSPIKFNKDRADMLVKMNIQTINPKDFDLKSIETFKETIQLCGGLSCR